MISRKQLYAMGEPIGESCTRHKLGGGYVCGGGGGGGKSESTNSTQTTTENSDKRAVVDGGSIGVTGDKNSLTTYNTSVDSTSIDAGKQIALAGIANNATNVDHLFAAAEALFGQAQKNQDAVTTLTGQLAGTAASAYSDATAQATGNKSLILVAIAVVGIAAVMMMKKA